VGNYALEPVRCRDAARAVAPEAVGMPQFSARDLKRQLEQFSASTVEDLDEVLHALLVAAYPSKRAQDN
jgi:hypothetical protein